MSSESEYTRSIRVYSSTILGLPLLAIAAKLFATSIVNVSGLSALQTIKGKSNVAAITVLNLFFIHFLGTESNTHITPW
ncbi:hypothetical protein [Sessilibacter sp. MAH4]